MKDDIYWERVRGRKRKSFYSYPETVFKGKKLVRGKSFIVVLEGIKRITQANPKGQVYLYVKSRDDAKKLSNVLKGLM